MRKLEFLDYEVDPAFRRRAKIIFSNIEHKSPKRILDLGCGRGYYTFYLSEMFPKSLVFGVDKNVHYLNQTSVGEKKNVSLVNADAQKLPFADSTFDLVVCSELLEHVTNDKKVLAEIRRVATKEAEIFITVPSANYPWLWDPINRTLEDLFELHIPHSIWWLAGIWADHVRLYSKKDLVNKVLQAGFEIKRDWNSTKWCIPFSHFLLYGIGKNLVERSMLKDFYRFNYETGKRSLLLDWVNKVFRSVDRFNSESMNDKDSVVNFVLKLKKN